MKYLKIKEIMCAIAALFLWCVCLIVYVMQNAAQIIWSLNTIRWYDFMNPDYEERNYHDNPIQTLVCWYELLLNKLNPETEVEYASRIRNVLINNINTFNLYADAPVHFCTVIELYQKHVNKLNVIRELSEFMEQNNYLIRAVIRVSDVGWSAIDIYSLIYNWNTLAIYDDVDYIDSTDVRRAMDHKSCKVTAARFVCAYKNELESCSEEI